MSLEVSRKRIDEILDLLKKGHWQVPDFQREYVWTQDQVKKLINSVLNSYPIGLITTWDQPQGKPHTPGKPLELKGGAQFCEFADSPAVIQLILDGKQRLTTLAMVFAGFKAPNARFNYSGEWFLDLAAYMTQDESKVVVYRKLAEIQSQELNVLSVCVRKRLIPFKHFRVLSDYIAKIHDPATYPAEEYPDADARQRMQSALTALQQTYQSFLIPFAQIPNSISLGDVCEIFDVLNTTGTKVSTFDLIHNILFRDSAGSFNLRETFRAIAESPSIGLLCDEGRPDFFCQLVTGSYCAINGVGRDDKVVSSIKGPDLINTPLSFYKTIAESSTLDAFADDFFDHVLGVDAELGELPYPASAVLYFALRWKMHQGLSPYTAGELNTVFRAFYWRNVLTNRYDQGFLTQFSADLRSIDEVLRGAHGFAGTSQWSADVNARLNRVFGDDYGARSVRDIADALITEETRGALRQLFLLRIKSSTKRDIVDGNVLKWAAPEKTEVVQLHHIFPRDWCNNNSAQYPEIAEFGPNCLANLTPLKAGTNNRWRANSPSTAVANLGISFENASAAFHEAFIDAAAFDLLKRDKVGEFWQRRADTMANAIVAMQHVNY